MPRTNKQLDKMDPNNDVFTNTMSFFVIATIVKIISTALPKVAFSSPEAASLCKAAANSSVPSPRIFARGMRAAKLNQKVIIDGHLQTPDATPNGMNTSKTEKGWMKMHFSPARLSGPGWIFNPCEEPAGGRSTSSKSWALSYVTLSLLGNLTFDPWCLHFIAMRFTTKGWASFPPRRLAKRESVLGALTHASAITREKLPNVHRI
mmetsp:Transcript_22088/g.58455  ORF Transcript_22088/g.58455 Transcript_22088/m.58455 type:complete len:206 (+) Transcript_22088:1286-1903(+)